MTAKRDPKWKQLEQSLQGVFGHAVIQAEGHEVKIVKRVLEERLICLVLVDGKIEGQWTRANKDGTPCHEQSKFYRPIRTRLFPKSKYDTLKTVFSADKAREMTELRVIGFVADFKSPRSLVAHYRKHFPDLVLYGTNEAGALQS